MAAATVVVGMTHAALASVAQRVVTAAVVAMLDAVAGSVQRPGQLEVAGRDRHECEEIEMPVDHCPATVELVVVATRRVQLGTPGVAPSAVALEVMVALAVAGLGAAGEQQTGGQERADRPVLPVASSGRVHWFILHACFDSGVRE
jgi:hypothetical protein